MTIEQKLDQMYAALAEMRIVDKLDTIKPDYEFEDGVFKSAHMDISGGTSRATAANRASLLINNIACLKDYLKAWCRQNGRPFKGEDLINDHREVAIIHDLWNLDKHAELNRSPRSGLSPRLEQTTRTAVVVSSSSGSGSSSVTFSFSPNGQAQAQGDVKVKIVAQIIDQNGSPLGDLETVARAAISAWEAEFVKAGLSLPPQP